MAENYPKFVSPVLTALTSQPAQEFGAFDTSGFCPVIKVAPSAHKGVIVVDRAVMTSAEADRDLSRSPKGDHPKIQVGDPATVDYECAEKASPRDEYAYVDLERAQEPLKFRERIARHLIQVVHQRVYKDVASLYTTAANWTNSSALVALGGSGVVLSDLVDGDILTDIQIAIENFQNANGQMDPAHLVLNRKALQYGTRQAKTRAVLRTDAIRAEGYTALVSHIETLTGVKVHVQTAAQNNALMWGASMILLPGGGNDVTMMDNGARIDATAGALIVEDFSFAPGDLYI